MGQSQSASDVRQKTKSQHKAYPQQNRKLENKEVSSSLAISPPGILKSQGSLAANWFQWKQNFEIYLKALGMDKNNECACALFLHCMGQYGIDIFNTLEITKPYTLQQFFTKFEQHCNPNTNIYLSRSLFFTTMQEENQTFDSFLEKLCQMSSSCQFGSLHNNLLLVQVISGISNSDLKQRLLTTQDLTLSDAIVQIRASEVQLQKQHYRKDTKTAVRHGSESNLPEAVYENIKKPVYQPRKHYTRNRPGGRQPQNQNRERSTSRPRFTPNEEYMTTQAQGEQLTHSAVHVEEIVTVRTQSVHNFYKEGLSNKCNVGNQEMNDASKVTAGTLPQAHVKKPTFKQRNCNTPDNRQSETLDSSIHVEAVSVFHLNDTHVYKNNAIHTPYNNNIQQINDSGAGRNMQYRNVPQCLLCKRPHINENCPSGTKPETMNNEVWNCYFCGKSHKRRNCPAYGTTCSKCGQRNHFAEVCKNSKNL